MKPIVVTLCGSTRFKQAFIEANFRETMAGRIVLSVGLYSHADAEVYAPMEAEKETLDQLHFRKIDMSDEILVLDCLAQVCPKCRHVWVTRLTEHARMTVLGCSCGADIEDVPPAPYIGASTRNEIAYAKSLGKRVRYLSEESRK